MIGPEALQFERHAWVPNNQRFPVLIYRGAVDPAQPDPAGALEQLFAGNGWKPRWRNGVFPYHHYHSTCHEVLGIARGRARLILGGPGGREVDVAAGDVILLPAGTGHCRMSGTDDFLVVGAYPDERDYDLCREAPSPDALRRIAELPAPERDPVLGDAGGSARLWQAG
jgi:uncharacterized protein YjlB